PFTERILPPSETEPNGAASEPSLNSDGTAVAYTSLASNITAGDTNNLSDIFQSDVPQVPNLPPSFTVRISVSQYGSLANGASMHPALSSLGGAVAYLSDATNLALADDNNVTDAFVGYVGGSSGLVSTANASPSYVPSVSGDGRFVAFES